ncbi:hypothetical protein ABI59_23895 [Acidobacteria bacterium Mor1]|nr:hypothetical protein ABI59_23895 [Acidobacteria bacterium Mor1]
MALLPLAEHTRRSLLALLEDDRPDGDRLLDRLDHLARLDGQPVFAAALEAVGAASTDEADDPRYCFAELLRHRGALHRKLGRDPGLRVAALDLRLRPEEQDRPELDDGGLPLGEGAGTLESTLGREVRRVSRFGDAFSLLVFEIDRFEESCLRYGDLFGELLLRKLDGWARRGTRETDRVFALGGSRTVQVLPHTDRAGAYARAERLRSGVRQWSAANPVGGRRLAWTVSCGIACHPQDGSAPEDLLEFAVRGAERAVAAGGDRVAPHADERRRNVRFPARPEARAGILHPRDASVEEVRGLDWSREGALFETRLPYRVDDPLRLLLSGEREPSPPTSWVADGRVVRIEGDAQGARRVGVEFDRAIPDDRLSRQSRTPPGFESEEGDG